MKLLLSICLFLAIAGLQARQPDFSDCHTFQDVLTELNYCSVSHLDLRIAKINTLMNSHKFIYGTCGGYHAITAHVKYQSPVKVVANDCVVDNCVEQKQNVIGNLVCEVGFVDPFLVSIERRENVSSIDPFLSCPSIEKRVEATKEIYTALYNIAKTEINHLLTDENFEVTFYVFNNEKKDGIWVSNFPGLSSREPICKWENGQCLYYAKFMENKNEDVQNVCDRSVKESGLTEQEVLQLIKNAEQKINKNS